MLKSHYSLKLRYCDVIHNLLCVMHASVEYGGWVMLTMWFKLIHEPTVVFLECVGGTALQKVLL